MLAHSTLVDFYTKGLVLTTTIENYIHPNFFIVIDEVYLVSSYTKGNDSIIVRGKYGKGTMDLGFLSNILAIRLLDIKNIKVVYSGTSVIKLFYSIN